MASVQELHNTILLIQTTQVCLMSMYLGEHMEQQHSQDWFSRAQSVIPGGVDSPVRAFNAVEGTPPFIVSAEGAYMTDEDGNRYIDLIGSWGPMIVGHAHPNVVQPFMKLRQQGHRLVHQPRQKCCLQKNFVLLIQL